MATNNSSQALGTEDEVKKLRATIQDLAERIEQVYLEYQDSHGAFIGKLQVSDRGSRRSPPASKFTKAYWKKINDQYTATILPLTFLIK